MQFKELIIGICVIVGIYQMSCFVATKMVMMKTAAAMQKCACAVCVIKFHSERHLWGENTFRMWTRTERGHMGMS